MTPVDNGVMFRPVQDLRQTTCPPEFSGSSKPLSCAEYITPVYADYETIPGATVTILSTLDGVNTWKVFEPQSNEYHTRIRLSLSGDNHGWTTATGTLETGIGTFSFPKPLI